MRVLVVYKKSRYEQYVLLEHDAAVRELVEHRDVSVTRYLESHEAHTRSLELIREHLTARGVSFEARFRGDVGRVEDDQWDLVVTVGGDGTVLDLSHRLERAPVLAINSDPRSSVGYFCAGTADDFPRLLDRVASGGWEPFALHRFGLTLNEARIEEFILNDVLIAHGNPAAVSSYILQVDDHAEQQKSSGIWLSTPAGSTAAIRSAGGLVMPLADDNFQYLVREPYPPPTGAYRLVKGIRPNRGRFEVISKMREGCVYLDGPHIAYPFVIGDRLSVRHDVPSLRIYGIDERRRSI